MRRLAILLGLGLAITSCKPAATSSTGHDAGAVVVAPPVAPTIRYVHASTLKLREAPSATARVRGRVDINSPLTVLDARDGFTHVRVANGKQGWVGSELLGAELLTVEQASAQATSSSTPAEKLTWWQRAAALSPGDVVVLGALREAYVAVGNDKAAGLVSRLLTALSASGAATRLRAVVDGKVEWQVVDALNADGATTPVPRERWRSVGLDPVELWVLPVDAPAVRVEPRAASTEPWNECGGTVGIAVDVGRAEGDLLALSGPPPSSWTTPPTPSWPKERFAAAQAEVEARYCKNREGCTVVGVSSTGHGAFFRATSAAETVEDMVHWRVTDIAFDEAGARREVAERLEQAFTMVAEPPVAMRDVVGDAAPELVFKNECGTVVTTLAGEILFVSTGRCCGC